MPQYCLLLISSPARISSFQGGTADRQSATRKGRIKGFDTEEGGFRADGLLPKLVPLIINRASRVASRPHLKSGESVLRVGAAELSGVAEQSG